MKRTLVGISALAVSALALSACSGSGDSGSGGSSNVVPGGTLKLAVGSDPGVLNPLLNATSEGATLSAFLYDQLGSLDPTSGKLVPQLASSWTSTPTSATFTLKSGVTCSDGTALTAQTVADNIKYVLNDKNASPWIGTYVPSDASVSQDAKAGTVTVTTKAKSSFIADMVGLLPIACQTALSKGKALNTSDGTGPYTLTSFQQGRSYTLALRKGYTWGPNGATTGTAGLPAKVELDVVSDQTTAANMLVSGQLNIAKVTGSDRARVAALAGINKVDIDTRPGLVWFNQAAGRVGADAKVRQALAMAMNRSELGKVSSSGLGKALTTMVSATPALCTGQSVEDVVQQFDVAGAKALLAADGWTAGSDGILAKAGKKLSISLLYPSVDGTPLANAIELLGQEWKAIGVQVKPQAVNPSQQSGVLFGTGNFDVAWVPIDTELPSEWTGIVSGPTPQKGGGDFASINNADYNKFSTAAAAQAGEASCGNWIAAERALFKATDVVPVTMNVNTYFGRKATFQMSKGTILPTTIRMTS